MKIVQLTPGSGDNFYCENCLRDNLLVQALRRVGHEAIILPMYLLPKLEETGKGNKAPVFFGGINVYLEQKFKFFRKNRGWLDRWLNARWLLNGAARMAGMTDSAELAETTLSMLRGEEGRQAKELDKLIDWLVSEQGCDVVCLNNALLMGVARRIRREVKAPVVCLLQDEDEFLEDLPEPLHGQCRREMIERGKEIDRFVAVSHYYQQTMQDYLELDGRQVTCIYNGLLVDEYQPSAAPPPTPTIGFLARMYPKKGLDLLAEAFVKLKQNDKLSAARLRLAGGRMSCDKSYVEGIRNKLEGAGVIDDVEFLPSFEREERLAFLQSLTVLSVPSRRGESSGFNTLEALACGVPVVQPATGVFPETLALCGGGVLIEEPVTAEKLAEALEPLLLDGRRARQLGMQGRKGVLEKFNIADTARNMILVFEQAITNYKPGFPR